VQENAGRAVTHGGLACRVRGWCATGPRIETRGNHHISSHPVSRQIGFLAPGLGLKENI
tara:strand:- start:725 stop:901 length:177 start_codon:yes stop_codon:yes gene_type:complete